MDADHLTDTEFDTLVSRARFAYYMNDMSGFREWAELDESEKARWRNVVGAVFVVMRDMKTTDTITITPAAVGSGR